MLKCNMTVVQVEKIHKICQQVSYTEISISSLLRLASISYWSLQLTIRTQYLYNINQNNPLPSSIETSRVK